MCYVIIYYIHTRPGCPLETAGGERLLWATDSQHTRYIHCGVHFTEPIMCGKLPLQYPIYYVLHVGDHGVLSGAALC